VKFVVEIDFLAEIYLLEVVLLKSLMPEAICQHTSREVSVGLQFIQIALQFLWIADLL
jgi:hypothetical protein